MRRLFAQLSPDANGHVAALGFVSGLARFIGAPRAAQLAFVYDLFATPAVAGGQAQSGGVLGADVAADESAATGAEAPELYADTDAPESDSPAVLSLLPPSQPTVAATALTRARTAQLVSALVMAWNAALAGEGGAWPRLMAWSTGSPCCSRMLATSVWTEEAIMRLLSPCGS